MRNMVNFKVSGADLDEIEKNIAKRLLEFLGNAYRGVSVNYSYDAEPFVTETSGKVALWSADVTAEIGEMK